MARRLPLLLAAACLVSSAPLLGLPKGPPRQAGLAAGVFLVADPGMGDPRFAHSVVLLLRYSEEGAMGLVVNKPVDVPFDELLPDLEGLDGSNLGVHYGGPVRQNQLLFLADTRPAEGNEDAEPRDPVVIPGVYLVEKLSGLKAILAQGGRRVRAYAGYAGWAPGQLDAELARHDWFVVSGDAESVFSEDLDSLWESIHDWLTKPTA